MLEKKLFKISNVPNTCFLLVCCHAKCLMRNKAEKSVKTNLPNGTLKTLTELSTDSRMFMRMHKHSSTRTRTRSLFKTLQVGWKELLQCCQKTVGLRSHLRGRTSVSHAAVFRLIPRGWHKPVLFYHYYSGCTRSSRQKDRLEEVKKPSDTAVSD